MLVKISTKFGINVLSRWKKIQILVPQKGNLLFQLLDVRDQIIQKVELEDGTPLSYKVDGLVDNFGSKLTVEIPTIVPGAK